LEVSLVDAAVLQANLSKF